jgi:hypothetical protein
LIPFLSLVTLKFIKSSIFTPASILRALRGEFFLTSGLASQPASVPCEPKLEATTHSKRQGTFFFGPLPKAANLCLFPLAKARRLVL